MERRREGARRRAGFTLAEVLVTLGIVAVLLALAVPSVAVVRKNLKMAELNATAREIFLAAQNNLTGLAAGGGALELSAKAGAADPDAVVCLMSGAPEDAEIMEQVLPLGAVDPTVAENHYMVVCYPATLTVKEIYYAERAFDTGAEELRTRYGGAGKADERRKDEIGFYDGENTTSTPARSLPKPVLTIENGEELVVRASIPELKDELIQNVKLTITVSSVENEKNRFEIYSQTQTGISSAEVTLDSLKGKHFQAWCVDSGIIPGENIRITAEVTCTDGDDKTWLTSEVSKVTNSLFGERNGDTVSVACGRHLQNLDTRISGVTSEVTSAVQTAAIDWSENGAEAFISIGNDYLTKYDGQGVEIRNLRVRQNTENGNVDGVGLFGVTAAGGKTTLSNIRIVNSNVKGGAGLPCGSLVGSVNSGGVDVIDCLVYWDGEGDQKDCYVSGSGTTSSVGGLIGTAEKGSAHISYCGVGLPSVEGSWCYGLGGLVGHAKNITITNSYAVADQLSGTAEQIGGLIGRGETVNVSNCYAVGNISAERRSDKPNGIISGFISGNGTVKDSYCAMTYLDENGEKRELKINYGFMSAMEHPTCAYLEPNAMVEIINKEAKDAVETSYDELKTCQSGPSWTALSELDSHSYRTLDDKGEPKYYPFPGLLAENGSPLPHYGSWPKEPEEKTAVAFVYYEVYTDDALGFEGLTLDGQPLEGTGLDQWPLKNGEDVMVKRDGYAIVSAEALSSKPVITLEYVRTKNIFGKEERTKIDLEQDAGLSVEGAVFYALIYDHVQAPSSVKDNFYQEVTYAVNTPQGQTTGSLWFNPCVAKTVSAERGSAETVPVRSARQLAALSEYSAGWSYSYVQELNIDEGVYDRNYAATLLHSAIGNKKTPFSGTYRGNGHRISGIELGENNYQDEWSKRWESYNWLWKWILEHIFGVSEPANASEWGLFGYNKGTLDSIVFLGDGKAQTVSARNCTVGGLCGHNEGVIQGCAVAGLRVSTNESSTAGGLVGINEGTVSGSYADSLSVTGKYVGGLVGEQTRGMVSNSYALGSLDPVGGNYTITQDLSAYAGGLVGKQTGGVVRDSYAACSAKKGTYTKYFPTSEKSENCYYLSDVWEQDEGTQGALSYRELTEQTIPGFSAARLDAAHSHPFDEALAGSAYPFPVPEGQTDHYGDWPVSDSPELPKKQNILGLFHYAKQEDGTYRFEAAALEITMDDFAYDPTVEGTVERPVGYPKPDADFWHGVEKPNSPYKIAPDGSGISMDEGIGFFFSKDEKQPSTTMTTMLKNVYYKCGAIQIKDLSAVMNGRDIEISDDYFFVTLPAQKQTDGSYQAKLAYTLRNSDNWAGAQAWECTVTFSTDGGVTITPNEKWD